MAKFPTVKDDPDARREFQRLRTLQSTGLLDAPAPSELGEICARAQERFQVAAALITLVAEDTLVVKARAGLLLGGTTRLGRFCEHTIRSNEVLVVPDAARDPRFSRNPLVTGWPFLRFYAGGPLIFARGARIGSLCLLDTEPHELTPTEMEELALTAERVTGLLLERAYETRFEQMIA